MFEKVYTIELDEDLARKAGACLGGRRGVEVWQGDAVQLLPILLQRPDVSNAILFLDAHYSGGPTACGEVPEPAIQELRVVSEHAAKVAAIVIDDFRCFGAEPGFPSKTELLGAAEEYFGAKGFNIAVFLDLLVIRHEGRVGVDGYRL